jgi:hypothetical protein
MQQDSRGWVHGLYAIVILTVQRPASLVGSPGRSVEVLPYVVRYELNASIAPERNATVHPPFTRMRCLPNCWQGRPAFHLQHIAAAGHARLEAWDRKSRCNWGERAFGSMTFVDNESMSPHNAARHALIERASVLVPPRSRR